MVTPHISEMTCSGNKLLLHFDTCTDICEKKMYDMMQ